MPTPRPSIAGIAKRVGVSKTTVSLALRNHPSLPKATIQRIRAVADEIGYKPHPFVSALMGTLTNHTLPDTTVTIGFLSREGPEDFQKQPRRRWMIEFTRARAEQLGYRLEHFCANDPEISPKRLEEILHARSIYGLVLGYSSPSRPITPLELDWSRFVLVTVGRKEEWPRVHCVQGDSYGNLIRTVRTLEERGYTRPALVMDRSSDECEGFAYRAAFHVYLDLHGNFSHKLPIFEPPQFDRASFHSWFRKYQPDVVISINPEVRDWILETGARIPEDVGFVNPGLPPEPTNVTGMFRNAPFIGSCAIDMIDAQIRRNECGIPAQVKRVTCEGIWNEGTTIRSLA